MMMRPFALLVGAVAMVSITAGARAQEVVHNVNSQYERAQLVQIADGLEQPWGVGFLPDGRFLVTEKPGGLQLIDAEGTKSEVTGLPEDILARGQGGLMDVVVHPEYEADGNGWIYLTYSKDNGEGQTATALIRARLNGTELVDVEEIFVQNRYSGPGRHYGSRVAFMHDGTLLVSIGDRGAQPRRAQDLADHAGTLLRLNDDGSVPSDNPFVGRDDAAPEIHSYGHRNIQGLVVHPETGEIWATQHGPRGGDRIDRLEAGKNYGWPVATPGRDYRTQEQFGDGRAHPDMVPPTHEFIPTLAPSGLAYVDGRHFSNWEGDFLAGGLRPQRILRVVIEEGTIRYTHHEGEAIPVTGPYAAHIEELLHGVIGRIRDVRTGPDGHIYIVNDRSPGGLYRLEPR